MKHILIDHRVSDACVDTLGRLGYSVVRLPTSSALPKEISAHPDTLIYKLRDGSLLMSEEYYRQNRNIFDSRSIRGIRLSKAQPHGEYPFDILFNALMVQDTVYGRIDMISDIILQEAKNKVAVKQGYARCSVAMLSEKAAITSDAGLAKALSENGISVLKISQGSIALDGYAYGFIGGAGGLLEKGLYASFGKIKAHPDGELICDFAERNYVKIIELSDEPLHDYGGFIVL